MAEHKHVLYSLEYGDEALPHLKDLVLEVEDPEKSRILSYLRLHCILACPGIIYNEIDLDKIIGGGNIFPDGTYFGNDALTKEAL